MALSFSSSFPFGFSELLLANRLIEAGRDEPWTFEVVAAAQGDRRTFLIAAGLDQVLALLEGLDLAETDLALLRAEPGPGKIDPTLDDAALDRVSALRFSGDVFAVPEGTVVFAGEPVLRIRAPAAEAVVIGTAVLTAMRTQTAMATRAARLKLVAGGKALYELGPSAFARDGSLIAARAAYLGGMTATSNPLAAGVWGIPALPVLSFSAVAAMGEACGPLSHCGILLDGDAGDRIDAAMAGVPEKPRAVLVEIASASDASTRIMTLRLRMNAQSWNDVALIGVGDFDEATIESLAQSNLPLDGFGIGASFLRGVEPTALAFEYELVERDVDGRRVALARRDGGRGARAVWRKRESGHFKGDTVQAETKAPPSGSMPLLVPMMERGKRFFRAPNLSELRVLCEAQLSMLDPAVTRRTDPAAYPVNCVIDEPAAPRVAAFRPPLGKTSSGRLIDQLDDSADFTLVSNAFASVVASRLAEQAIDPMSEASAGEPAAEDGQQVVEPPEIELEEIVEDPTQMSAYQEVASARDYEPLVPKTPLAPNPVAAAPAARPSVAPPPPKSQAAAAPVAPRPVAAPPPAAVTAPPPAAANAPPAPVAVVPPAAPPAPPPAAAPATPAVPPELAGNPLLAAAARLRSMQSGGAPPLPKPAAAPVDAPRVAAPAAKSAAKETDPLLAAAARLKSMRGGG